MLYIIFNFVALMCFITIQKLKLSNYSVNFIGIIIISIITILPGFQFGVGSDYFSYQATFDSVNGINDYYNNHEYSFYFLTCFIKYLGFSSNAIFLLIAIIQSCLIWTILKKLYKQNYNIAFLFFCFFCVTNMMHTQMNLLRSTIATYFFVLAVIERFSDKNIKSFIYIIIGATFHNSILLVSLLLCIPFRFYFSLLRRPFVYFISLFVFFLFFDKALIINIVSSLNLGFFARYIQYVNSDLVNPIGLLATLSKVYYFPLSVFFIYIFNINVKDFSQTEKLYIAFWLLTANFYLTLMSMPILSRVNYYFVFFYIIPCYYVFKYLVEKRNVFYIFCVVVYIFAPYFVKVVFIPMAEFKYQTYIF